MSRAGVAHPDHPDNYGRAIERHNEREVAGQPLFGEFDLTDAQMDAAWEMEAMERKEAAIPHRHGGCGHDCLSGACVLFAGLHDHLCNACQMTEPDERGGRYWPLPVDALRTRAATQ